MNPMDQLANLWGFGGVVVGLSDRSETAELAVRLGTS